MALSYDDAAHLLRRTGYGSSAAEIQALVGIERVVAVERLLDMSGAPVVTSPPEIGNSAISDFEKYVSCTHWWIDRMATTPTPLQEKMTFFWHNHFATSRQKVESMDLMWAQQQILRAGCMGNFRDLTMAVCTHPALLWYLDNTTNVAAAPNENFARELMELFTLGVGNYSQTDVVAAARAWTGHGMVSWSNHTYQFDSARHDNGIKTFMGSSRNWDGPDIINELLRDNAATRLVSARFIARKAWNWFAYSNPSDATVSGVANAFLTSDFNIVALLRAMLNHDDFYSAQARMALVRTPVEYIVATMRSLGIDAATCHPVWYLAGMGMEPFSPPNVSGWKTNLAWVTSAAFWAKSNFIQYSAWRVVEGASAGLANIGAKSISEAAQEALDLFGIPQPCTTTRNSVTNWLTKQRSVPNEGWVDRRFLISLVALSPDFQLA